MTVRPRWRHLWLLGWLAPAWVAADYTYRHRRGLHGV